MTRSTCSRAGVLEHGGKLFCKQHHPDAEAARRAATNAKFEAEWELRKRNQAASEVRATCEDVIRKIAEGHNDPRRLAEGFIAKLDGLRAAAAAFEEENKELLK